MRLEDRLTERLRDPPEKEGPQASDPAATATDDAEPAPASQVDRRWRVGSQVLRTLYTVDPDDEALRHPDQFFGSVDTPELAAHIVELHNRWLDEDPEEN